MIDWTISVGNIMTVMSLVGAAGGVMFNMGKQMQKFDYFSGEIGDFRNEMKDLSRALSTMAVQASRLDMHEKQIDELRRGIGLILPSNNRGNGN